MPTEPPFPLNSLPRWLRASAGRARRWLAARGAVARVGLFVVVLGVLGSAGYFASINDPGEMTWSWIWEGHKLSSDEVQAISDALDAENIAHIADRATGKVGVKPARKAEALAALNKRKIAPRTLGELSHEEAASPWDLPEDRQRREFAARERTLKYMIEELNPSIQEAHVQILRTQTRRGINAPLNVGALVYLKLEGRRQLEHRMIVGIETFLKAEIPELNPKNTYVIDSNGTNYMEADNPEITKQLKTHAQEETWREKISEALQHIRGVGVDVRLEAVPVLPPLPAPVPVASDEPVQPNSKVIIDPEPPIEAPALPPQPPKTKANVWVRVPRTFYLLDFAARSPNNRLPTQDDLEQMKETTEKLIHDAVEIHIPKEERGEVKVSVIQDDLDSPRQILSPLVSEPHRPWTWVALSGVVVLAGVGAVATMVRLATRRQPARPSRSSLRPGYVADGPSSPLPGPSERVRELIRANPEAAAGVLQRWIGQGGTLP